MPKSHQPPTLREVSDATGLSVYSVSRALSGQNGVSENTRTRVQQAARELGYVPNQLARSLKGKSSRTVGILAAHTANQYYATLVGSIDQELRQAGFQSVLADTAADGAFGALREDNFVSALLEQRVAAMVVTYSISEANLRRLTLWQIPVVFVDCVAPAGNPAESAVLCDNERAGHLVGDHFTLHRYRRWAFLGYPPRWSSRLPREAGFRASADRHGATVDVIECGNDCDTAYQATVDYLRLTGSHHARALYCANTPLLQGALRAFEESKIKVPDDVAVIAFDDFDWAALLKPAVTVVDQHTSAIGQQAASLLLAKLKASSSELGKDIAGQRLIEPELIVRNSCGCGTPRATTVEGTIRGRKSESSTRR